MKQAQKARRATGRDVAKSLLLAVTSIVVTWIVLELMVFYVLNIKPDGYESDRFFVYSPHFGHFHKPNAEGYWYM